MSSNSAIFKDFTQKRRPISFGIDGEEFHCHKALGAETLQEAMLRFRDTKEDGSDITADLIMDKMFSALELLLKEESFIRFKAIIKDKDRDEPVDIFQLKDIFSWLIEQYVQRPTEAFSGSLISPENANAGTSSPDGAQLEASTHSN